jgi:hypothetical protein
VIGFVSASPKITLWSSLDPIILRGAQRIPMIEVRRENGELATGTTGCRRRLVTLVGA